MTTDVMDFVSPTAERLRHARHMSIETPLVDQRVARRTWRLVSVIDAMIEADKLDDTRKLAWERFSRDWNVAGIQPGVVARYGERAGLGGTPVAQMTAEALDMADAVEVRRIDAIDRVSNALLTLVLPRLQQAVVMVASEECNLEMIGARISRYRQRGQRIAVASAAIEDALWLLGAFYQRLYGQASPAP